MTRLMLAALILIAAAWCAANVSASSVRSQEGQQTASDSEPYVLVIHDLNGPPEALQTPYIEWAMEALPACADDDPDECVRMVTFIRGGAHISFCESGQQPTAVNSISGASGMWQIMRRYHEWRFTMRGWPWEAVFDPVKSTVVAYEIYRDSGYSWSAWSCAHALGMR